MRFFKNPNNYTFLLSRPDHRGTVSVPAAHFVEGEYYSRFSYLVEVPEKDVPASKVVFWQSKLPEKMNTAPIFSKTERPPALVESTVTVESADVVSTDSGAVESMTEDETKVVEEPKVAETEKPSINSLKKMSKDELIELAKSSGMVLTGEETKPDLISLLK